MVIQWSGNLLDGRHGRKGRRKKGRRQGLIIGLIQHG